MLQQYYFINIVQHAFEALKDFFYFLRGGMNWVWAIVVAIGIFFLKGWAHSTANNTPSQPSGYSIGPTSSVTDATDKPKLEDTGIGRFILVVAIVGVLVFICYIVASA